MKVFAKKCVSVPFQSRYFMLKLIPASTIILSTLLPGTAVHQLHAQTDPPIFRWGGSVEVSTSTLTIREGETVSYSVRLSEQPLADGWWVFVQVDGVVYPDGEFTKPGETEPWIRWVPSVGWKTDPVPGSSDPTRWRTVSITACQDDDDDDEFLTFTHEVWDKDTNCPEFLHAVAPVQVRIIDDDRPGGTAPDLEIQDAEVTEGGIADFTVTLSSAATGAVTVSYATVDGTATAGADYTTTSGTLSFTSGQTTKRVEVQTLQDTDQEGAESFTVRLSGATGATLTDGVATGTILDDDDRPSLRIGDARVTEGGTAAFTVTLSSAATGAVTVSYATVDGTATAGADYTTTSGTLSFTPGQTTKRVEVQTLPDTDQEGAESFTVRLSGATGATLTDGVATGTILDNDEAPTITIGDARVTEGGTAAFTVTLSSAATRAVTVSYATVDGTATAGADYTTTSGMLTFEVNGDRTQRVEVPTLEDDEAEETETFTVQLSALSGATVADGTGTGTITDNVQRSSRGVHRIVLPEMARAMAFTPNCRIEQALSGAPVQLAGDGGRARLSLSSALTSGRRTGPGAEPLTIDQALDDVRFLTSSQQEGGSGGFAAWGCADRLSLNGGAAGPCRGTAMCSARTWALTYGSAPMSWRDSPCPACAAPSSTGWAAAAAGKPPVRTSRG